VHNDVIPQVPPHPTSAPLEEMMRRCKRSCRCSPVADGYTLELNCKKEVGEDCPELCDCKTRQRSSAARIAALQNPGFAGFDNEVNAGGRDSSGDGFVGGAGLFGAGGGGDDGARWW
jgi:hypothetical protein